MKRLALIFHLVAFGTLASAEKLNVLLSVRMI